MRHRHTQHISARYPLRNTPPLVVSAQPPVILLRIHTREIREQMLYPLIAQKRQSLWLKIGRIVSTPNRLTLSQRIWQRPNHQSRSAQQSPGLYIRQAHMPNPRNIHRYHLGIEPKLLQHIAQSHLFRCDMSHTLRMRAVSVGAQCQNLAVRRAALRHRSHKTTHPNGFEFRRVNVKRRWIVALGAR